MDDNMRNIPKEKLRFATKRDLAHDSRFETKPVSYFQGAFNRFCKNKGAVVGGIVIAVLVLFAIFAPLFTPFEPKYYDMVYSYVTPKNSLFVESGIDFWDGYKVKSIVVDGIPLTGNELQLAIVDGYTFAEVDRNHTISVDFETEDVTLAPRSSSSLLASFLPIEVNVPVKTIVLLVKKFSKSTFALPT